VADGMAWDVEDIEAAIAEEVVGGVLADLGGGGVKGDLMDCTAPVLVRALKRHQAARGEAYSKSLSNIGESFLPG